VPSDGRSYPRGQISRYSFSTEMRLLDTEAVTEMLGKTVGGAGLEPERRVQSERRRWRVSTSSNGRVRARRGRSHDPSPPLSGCMNDAAAEDAPKNRSERCGSFLPCSARGAIEVALREAFGVKRDPAGTHDLAPVAARAHGRADAHRRGPHSPRLDESSGACAVDGDPAGASDFL